MATKKTTKKTAKKAATKKLPQPPRVRARSFRCPQCVYRTTSAALYNEHRRAHVQADVEEAKMAEAKARSSATGGSQSLVPTQSVSLVDLLAEIGVDNLEWQLLSRVLVEAKALKPGGTEVSFLTAEPLKSVAVERSRNAFIVWVDTSRIQTAWASARTKKQGESLGAPNPFTPAPNSDETTSESSSPPSSSPAASASLPEPVRPVDADSVGDLPERFDKLPPATPVEEEAPNKARPVPMEYFERFAEIHKLLFEDQAREDFAIAVRQVNRRHGLPSALVEAAPEVFRTSFCNNEHRMKDGMPVDHGCYVLPPRALQLEREGKLTEAQNLLQEIPREERRISRGVRPDVDEVPPLAYYQGWRAARRGLPRTATIKTGAELLLWLAGYDKYEQVHGSSSTSSAPSAVAGSVQVNKDDPLTALSAVGAVRGLLFKHFWRTSSPTQTLHASGIAQRNADLVITRLREEILAGVPKQRDPREYFEKYLEMGHVPAEPPILRKAMREGFDLVVRTLDGSSSDDGPDVPDGPVEEGFAPGFEERCGDRPTASTPYPKQGSLLREAVIKFDHSTMQMTLVEPPPVGCGPCNGLGSRLGPLPCRCSNCGGSGRQLYCARCGDKLSADQRRCDDEGATGAGSMAICGGEPVLFRGLSAELQKRWQPEITA